MLVKTLPLPLAFYTLDCGLLISNSATAGYVHSSLTISSSLTRVPPPRKPAK
jgi:hypothetical protein